MNFFTFLVIAPEVVPSYFNVFKYTVYLLAND